MRKKTISLLLLALFVPLMLTACGGADEEVEDTTEKVEEVEVTKSSALPVAVTIMELPSRAGVKVGFVIEDK